MSRELIFESGSLSEVLNKKLLELNMTSLDASNVTGIDKYFIDDIISSKAEYISYPKLVMLSKGLNIPIENLYIYCDNLAIKPVDCNHYLFSIIFYENFDRLLKIFNIDLKTCIDLLETVPVSKQTPTMYNGRRGLSLKILFNISGFFNINPSVLFRNYLSLDNKCWEINEPDTINDTEIPNLLRLIRSNKGLSITSFSQDKICDSSIASRIEICTGVYSIINFIDYCGYMGLNWENLLIGNKTIKTDDQIKYIEKLNKSLNTSQKVMLKRIIKHQSTLIREPLDKKILTQEVEEPNQLIDFNVNLEVRCKLKVKCVKGDFNDESDVSDLSIPFGYYWKRTEIQESKLDIFKGKFNNLSFKDLDKELRLLITEEAIEAKFEILTNSENCFSKMNFIIQY